MTTSFRRGPRQMTHQARSIRSAMIFNEHFRRFGNKTFVYI